MKIVSLLSSATEMLFALGMGERVLAVSHECDWPPEVTQLPRATRSRVDSAASSEAIDAQVKCLLAAGEPLYELDKPLIRALRPDLIVTQAQCDVCSIRLEDVLTLQHSSPELTHSRVVSLNPHSLADVLGDVLRIGQATGKVAQAELLVAGYRARIDFIHHRTANLSQGKRPRILCIEWADPLMPAGNWTPDLIELAGGRSGLATPGEHSRYATWDEAEQFDPEVVVVAPCGFDLNRTLAETRRLLTIPQMRNFSAVRQNLVFALDGSALLNRSGPRLVESLEVLAHIFQPTLFPEPLHAHFWRHFPARE